MPATSWGQSAALASRQCLNITCQLSFLRYSSTYFSHVRTSCDTCTVTGKFCVNEEALYIYLSQLDCCLIWTKILNKGGILLCVLFNTTYACKHASLVPNQTEANTSHNNIRPNKGNFSAKGPVPPSVLKRQNMHCEVAQVSLPLLMAGGTIVPFTE